MSKCLPMMDRYVALDGNTRTNTALVCEVDSFTGNFRVISHRAYPVYRISPSQVFNPIITIVRAENSPAEVCSDGAPYLHEG